MDKEYKMNKEISTLVQDQVDFYRDNPHMQRPDIIKSIAETAFKQGFLDGFVAGIHSDPEILVSINDIGNIDQMTLIDIPEKTIEAEEIGEEY